jgi:hypothetical protein
MAAADPPAAKRTAGSSPIRGAGPGVRPRRMPNADANDMQRLIVLVMKGAIAEIACAFETRTSRQDQR